MINIFIDESGIHKKVDHSSFVLVYIQVNNIQKIETSIKNIENSIGIDSFHWAKTAKPVKEKFIIKALDLNFKIKIAIIKNPIKPDKELERILSHAMIEKDINKVIVDGKKPKWYERKIKLILRNKGISVRKLKTMKDEQSPGIRLADMCAGLTRTCLDDQKSIYAKYYRKLEKKTIIVLR